MKAFTSYEEHQDVVFGLCYLVIALLTANRLWGVALRGRKVIIAFNSLILATSLLRATWFFIPNYYLEPSYVPLPVRAWKDSPWRGVFVSQLLLTSGTLSLYGCFIVIACYWAHILQKLHYSEGSQPGTAALEVSAQVHGGTLRRFSFAAAGLLAVEAINALCFLCGVYNSEAMVLYDCLIFAIVSLVVARHIVGLSEQMARAIDGLQVISRSTSQAQARRIHAMMVVATAFFVSRVVLECLLGIPVLWRIYGNTPPCPLRHHRRSTSSLLPRLSQLCWELGVLDGLYPLEAWLRGGGAGTVPARLECHQVLRLLAPSAGPRAAQTQSCAPGTRSITTTSKESDICRGASATARWSPGLVLTLHMTILSSFDPLTLVNNASSRLVGRIDRI